MRRSFVLFAVICTFLAAPALAQDQHKHRRPDDIKQYLEHLDRAERDQYQKPAEVMEALDLMDNGKKANMDLLLEIGQATGRTFVDATYPDPKFDLPEWRGS